VYPVRVIASEKTTARSLMARPVIPLPGSMI